MKTDREQMDRCVPLVQQIHTLYAQYQTLSNDEIRQRIRLAEKTVVAEGIPDTTLCEVFALFMDTCRRFASGDVVVTADPTDREFSSQKLDFLTVEGDKAVYHCHWLVDGMPYRWNMVPFEEQLIGGIFLHKGYAVEMATGEGKTLVATLPVALNALTHQGVHVMTANTYLSNRDMELTRPLYAFWGLTCGCLVSGSHLQKKKAYTADIVFGTDSEFIFDYLGDHLVTDPGQVLQTGYNFAVIDELDAILVDDAVTPHIISGGFYYDNGEQYRKYLPVFLELLELQGKAVESTGGYIYYTADRYNKETAFTDEGQKWLASRCGLPDLYRYRKPYQVEGWNTLPQDEQERYVELFSIQNIFNQLLTAYTVYQRNIDYIVTDKKVVIVNESTGRLEPSRRWSHGLHTAVEVKEQVETKKDSRGQAVISLKNYFIRYKKVAGMSGTIRNVAEELKEVYGLETVSIPTHRPVCRKDHPVRLFLTRKEKMDALVRDIVEIHQTGQPLLVGSPSILEARQLAKLLDEQGIRYNLLDALSLKDEAYLISKAGTEGTLTLSTPVSGRGTDIKLSAKARELGGLAVVCTELNESVRIDRQLKGRSGRQGDPGSSVSYASLEDNIFLNLTESERERLDGLVRNGKPEGIQESRALCELAQQRRDAQHYVQRKKSIFKDDVIDPYRERFYRIRNRLLSDPLLAVQLITGMDGYQEREEDVWRNVRNVYDVSRELFRKYYAQHYMEDDTFPIACAVEQKLFSLLFPFDPEVFEEERFMQEVFRQVLLVHYDEYWGQFVPHLLGNLDQQETRLLPEEFVGLTEKMARNIVECLATMVIPGLKEQLEEMSPAPNGEKRTLMEEHTRMDGEEGKDSLCFCGSGKSFYECHGKNGTRKKKRR